MSGIKVTRIATSGQELAGGSTLDATYTGTDVDVTTGLPLDGLLDVNAPTPIDQDVLTWDDAAGEWIAQAVVAGASALDDLTDVNVPAPNDNDVLTWDFGTTTWIAAAGASGSVATDAIWDTKGDLAVGSGANAAARLAVGSNAYVLTADSAQPLGVKWAAASNSGIADQGAFTYLDATEGAAPGTPSAGFARIYAKTDGRIYSKDDGGTEYGPFDAAGPDPAAPEDLDIYGPHRYIPLAEWGNKSGTEDRAYSMAIPVSEDCTIAKVWYVTGGTTTGSANLDIGVYDDAGNLLVSTGSFAFPTGNNNTFYFVDVADTAITAGVYYVAVVLDTIAGTAYVQGITMAQNSAPNFGVLHEDAAFPLPDPATWTEPTSDTSIFLVGFATRAL